MYNYDTTPEYLENKQFVSSFILDILINIEDKHEGEENSSPTKEMPDIMVVIKVEKHTRSVEHS